MAVRESAPLTAKPWERADAILVAPRAVNSRSTSMSQWFLAAKLRAVSMAKGAKLEYADTGNRPRFLLK